MLVAVRLRCGDTHVIPTCLWSSSDQEQGTTEGQENMYLIRTYTPPNRVNGRNDTFNLKKQCKCLQKKRWHEQWGSALLLMGFALKNRSDCGSGYGVTLVSRGSCFKAGVGQSSLYLEHLHLLPWIYFNAISPTFGESEHLYLPLTSLGAAGAQQPWLMGPIYFSTTRPDKDLHLLIIVTCLMIFISSV